MLRNQLILIHLTKDITSANDISLLEVHGLVQPLALSIPLGLDEGMKPTCSGRAHQLLWE